MTQNSIETGDRMNPNAQKNPISPVMQFSLLLAPVVLSCFFLVYALTGWVVEGREKMLWSTEAIDVAWYTGLGIVGYCIVVMVYARLKGTSRYHVLNVSSVGHIVIAVLLGLSVLVAVKL